MLRSFGLFLTLLLMCGPGEAAAPVSKPKACVASVPLGTFQLSVLPSGGGPARPLREQNILQAGQKIAYKPVQIPRELEKEKMCLVLVPADITEQTPVTVLDATEADEPAEWAVPFRVSVVGIVFGPQGLDRKKVSKLVAKDQELMSQLADYAEQTSQVETLVEALATAEEGPSRSKNLQAALNGFASRFGTNMTKLDTTAPTDQQAAALLHTLNPALGSYDPLASQTTTRMAQSASLAASVAGLFFGTPVGLAAGSAAMAQNMRTILFPDTDFRSALMQTADAGGMTMCAKRRQQKSRTRLAYLWAHRIPNAAAPAAALSSAAHVPLGAKSGIALGAETKYLDRAHGWVLVSNDGKQVPVSVKAAPKSLELDLEKAAVAPGIYKLAAKWDWDSFDVNGEVQVHALPDLAKVQVTPHSADLLVEGAGVIPVQLAGADFQFVEKAALKGAGELEFKLPAGKRTGSQETMDVMLDVSKLKPGPHRLVLSQAGRASAEVPFRVLPPHPRIENLPVRVNAGEKEQKILLRGTGLERVQGIEIEQGKIELGPVQPGKNVREAVVRLGESAKRDDRLTAAMKVEGVQQPLKVAEAILVAGPRPVITSVKESWPDDLGVSVREGELPAGSFVSFSMRIENLEGQPALRLGCAEKAKTLQVITLHPGEKTAAARLDAAGQDVMFLSLDPGVFGQSGCTLTAVLDTDAAGASEPYTLGKVLRLPRIEYFTLTDEKAGESAYVGLLTGHDLETIDKAGWIPKAGLPVDSLPKPVAGEGQKQTLKLALPWPSPAPKSPVYIWLRGEREGRITKAKY
jgi:hypothetical protein